MGLLDRLKKSGSSMATVPDSGAGQNKSSFSAPSQKNPPQPPPPEQGKTESGLSLNIKNAPPKQSPQSSASSLSAAIPRESADSHQSSAPAKPSAAKPKPAGGHGGHGANDRLVRARDGKLLYEILDFSFGHDEKKAKVDHHGSQPKGIFARLKKTSDEDGVESDVTSAFTEKVQNLLYEQFQTQKLDEFETPEEEKKFFTQKIDETMHTVFTSGEKFPLNRQQLGDIRIAILDGIVGFGPIQRLLESETITEVMVNGPNHIFVEQKGKLTLTDVKFKNNQQIMHVIKKIIAPLGRRCDESCPLVDARLPDGSRVNAIIPPLALCGPTITIRRFSDTPFKVKDLVGFGTLTQEMGAFIKACIEVKLNCVVSGGTGSGKTTTLNAISGFVPHDERIITVEDAAELQLLQDHVVSLETRPPNIEGKGAIHIRDLVRNSLRMNPDRIIVGECRGGEALDMLSAMNTGNDGSLTTGHANSPKDMVARLETMVMMSGMELPSRVIREQIASAINIFIQQNRLQDGSRKITHVTEVAGIADDGQVEIRNIFEWRQEGLGADGKIVGALVPTGNIPTFLLRFKEHKIELPENIFGDNLSYSKLLIEAEEQRDLENQQEMQRLLKIRDQQESQSSASYKPSAEELAKREVFDWAKAEILPKVVRARLAAESEAADDGDTVHKTGLAGRLSRKSSSAGGDEREEKRKAQIQNLMFDIQERLSRLMQFDDSGMKFSSPEEEREVMTEKITTCYRQAVYAKNLSFSRQEADQIIAELVYEVCGLGAMQKLLDREDITEVMVNGPDHIFIELKGKLLLSDVKFKDNAAVMHVIQKIVVPLGRRCDESSPLVDARLKDGSRVNAIIPPLALCGPTITIRKFSDDPFTIWNLVDFGTLTKAMAEFINACIMIKLNMVVSGGTGSGKTTTLNAISGFIPHTERIITVEDAAELQLLQDHVVSLETRPPNVEGKGAVHIRDLVRNSLRMNPDRIIVGECRGGEALDMLSAMNTGNDGSLTTGHANSPKDMVARLETMVMMSGMDLPSRVIREQIASAINIFIQQNRLQDGSRKITHITEIAGIDDNGLVEIRNIFEWQQHGLDEKGKVIGALVPTGIVPTFMLKFKEEQVDLPDGIFGDDFNVNEVFTRLEKERFQELEAQRLEMIARSKKYAEESGTQMSAKDKAALNSRPVFKYYEHEVLHSTHNEKDKEKDSPREQSGRKSLKSLRSLAKTEDTTSDDKLEKIRNLIFKTMSAASQYEEFPESFESQEAEIAFFDQKLREAYKVINDEFHYNLPRLTVDQVMKECVDNIVGFGAIQQLLDVEDITEIMVNGPDKVFIELKGKLKLSDVQFRDNASVMQVISKIIAPLGRRCDASCPLVDARLPDGSRVNAIIPPLALCGPTITIRKFAEDPFRIKDLIGFGTMTQGMGDFIEACILIKLNMVVSGGTGSGKTTTLNAISGFIPHDERIITVEDAAELQLLQDHVVSLETRPPNVEGKGAVSIRELVRNSLRMNPDRIIVGECRGGEALDMLSAMNTGNDGSLTTGHANSPKDMVSRLETMVMMSGMDLPSRVIREQIASAVDLIIQQNRLQDGSRKITHITEIRGIDDNGLVDIRNIFEWQQHGLDENGKVIGDLVPSGEVPSFLLRFKEENVPLPDGLFGEGFDLNAAYKLLEIQAKERAARQLARAKARSQGLTPPIAYDDELKLRNWLKAGKITNEEFDAAMAAGKLPSTTSGKGEPQNEAHTSNAKPPTGQTAGVPDSQPGLAALPPVPQQAQAYQQHVNASGNGLLQLGDGSTITTGSESHPPKPEDFATYNEFLEAKERIANLALPEQTKAVYSATDDHNLHGEPVQHDKEIEAAPQLTGSSPVKDDASNIRSRLGGNKESGNSRLRSWLNKRAPETANEPVSHKPLERSAAPSSEPDQNLIRTKIKKEQSIATLRERVTEQSQAAHAQPQVQQRLAHAQPQVQQRPAQAQPQAQQRPAQAQPQAQQRPAQAQPQVQQRPAQAQPQVQQRPAQAQPQVQQRPAQAQTSGTTTAGASSASGTTTAGASSASGTTTAGASSASGTTTAGASSASGTTTAGASSTSGTTTAGASSASGTTTAGATGC